MSLRKLATKANPNCDQSENDDEKAKKQTTVALGNGSEVVLIPRFISFDRAWSWFDYLNTKIPWTRPTIRVFGRSCLQVCLSLCLRLLVVGFWANSDTHDDTLVSAYNWEKMIDVNLKVYNLGLIELWTQPVCFVCVCFQPRDTCYVASPGLPHLVYSGYQPHAYSWDDLPPLKELLEAVPNNAYFSRMRVVYNPSSFPLLFIPSFVLLGPQSSSWQQFQ